MTCSFHGLKVLVTGGTQGIGKAIAQAFYDNGAHVTVTGQTPLAPEDINPSFTYEPLVLGSGEWKTRVRDIVSSSEGFDILINNAGTNAVASLPDLDPCDLDKILTVNLYAPIYLASLISQKMVEKKKGFILNISSIFGVVSKEGRSSYTASKSGLIGVTKTMAIDLGKYGVMVNAISPGFVDTKLTRRILGEEGMKAMSAKIPLGRLATINDIVPSVLFLCSSHNTYITGQNLIVDGGFTLE